MHRGPQSTCHNIWHNVYDLSAQSVPIEPSESVDLDPKEEEVVAIVVAMVAIMEEAVVVELTHQRVQKDLGLSHSDHQESSRPPNLSD